MIGNNQWRLNAATLVQMIQEWVDRNMAPDVAPKVLSITNHVGETFAVELRERLPDEREYEARVKRES